MRGLDFWITLVSVLAFNMLTLFVVHATILLSLFIRRFSGRETWWPKETLARHKRTPGAEIGDDFLREYLDLRLIGIRSEAVTELIYYPFITISLMILSRIPQFDNWDWPPTLIIIFAFDFLLASGCVFALRTLAKTTQSDCIGRLRELLRESRAADNIPRCNAIESLIQECEQMDNGIFAPIGKQPLIRALLIPTGGFSIGALFQYLAS